jgi:hypothetical protein
MRPRCRRDFRFLRELRRHHLGEILEGLEPWIIFIERDMII